MNKEQFLKLKTIIENDCAIRARYENETGETCAVGAMIKAVGEECPDGEFNTSGIYKLSRVSRYSKILDKVMNEFGLNLHELAFIQTRNDAAWTVERRRLYVLSYLEGLIQTQPSAAS